jgi:hypothetical protein
MIRKVVGSVTRESWKKKPLLNQPNQQSVMKLVILLCGLFDQQLLCHGYWIDPLIWDHPGLALRAKKDHKRNITDDFDFLFFQLYLVWRKLVSFLCLLSHGNSVEYSTNISLERSEIAPLEIQLLVAERMNEWWKKESKKRFVSNPFLLCKCTTSTVSIYLTRLIVKAAESIFSCRQQQHIDKKVLRPFTTLR